jgi:uncharacterized membrane protein
MKIITAIIALHILLYAAIGLNIPVLRPIFAFLYLSIVPGFAFLSLLGIRKQSFLDMILFSIGSSLAISMFVALILNISYPIISQPFSEFSLTVAVSGLSLMFLFIGHRKALLENFIFFETYQNKARLLFPKSAIYIFPPILGIMGAIFGSVLILMLLLVLIAVLFALGIFSKKLVPSELYPVMIFSIALALLFHMGFTSKYIIGYDSQLEFNVFRNTQINGHWAFLDPNYNSAGTALYNSMLSITLLPAVYSTILNISGEGVFKVFYPFILSLVPVSLFRIYAQQIGKSASLVSVFFLISNFLAFWGFPQLSLNRQIVAEFFLVLSLMVILNRSIPVGKRRLLLIFFGASLAVSHYSLMYIYLLVVSLLYAYNKIRRSSDFAINSLTLFLLFFVTFSWYSYSIAPLNALTTIISKFYSNFFIDFFNASSRLPQVSQSQPVSDISSVFSTGIFVIVNLLIAIGFLNFVSKSKGTKIDPGYRLLCFLSGALILLCLALPNFAPTLNINRFYMIALLTLAPLSILGFNGFVKMAGRIWQKVTKQKFLTKRYSAIKPVLLCILLICFFLTQTGFVNHITGLGVVVRPVDLDRINSSNSNQVKTGIYEPYISEYDAFATIWLTKYRDSFLPLYADAVSLDKTLCSIGLIQRDRIIPLDNAIVLKPNSYVFFGRQNIVLDLLILQNGKGNFTEALALVQNGDLIYSNNASQIWFANPTG